MTADVTMTIEVITIPIIAPTEKPSLSSIEEGEVRLVHVASRSTREHTEVELKVFVLVW